MVVLALPQVVTAFALLAIGSGWLVSGLATTMLTLRRGRPVSPAMLDRVVPEWLGRRAATVGARAGAGEMAAGALLLFATNAVGILLAGSAVFVLTSVTPVRRILRERRRIHEALGTVTVFALVVFAVLAVSSDRLITTAAAVDDVPRTTLRADGTAPQ